MKKIRQSVSILLTMIMVLSVFTVSPFSVFADDNTVTDETTLKAKINAGESVKLGAPITLSSRLKIDNGASVTIDLNGYKLDRNSGESFNSNVIYLSNYSMLTITDSSGNNSGLITGGYATYGGGVYVGSDCIFIMKGGTISSNQALYDGGGIYIEHGDRTNVSLEGGIIENNHSNDDGGGICIDEDATVNISGNVVIRNNTSDNRGGGIYSYDACPTITNCEISGNIAKKSGGGIYINNTSRAFQLTNCNISNNEVAIEDENISGGTLVGGGGIFVKEGIVNLNNCTVDGNKAIPLQYEDTNGSYIVQTNGGGICLSEGSRLVMSGGSVNNNEAYMDGGISLSRSSTSENKYSNAELTNVTISYNTASDGCGGVGIGNKNTFVLKNSIVANNKALRYYGGIQNAYGYLTIENSTITQNTSNNYAGGICIAGETTIKDSFITKNSARCGGGIYIFYFAGIGKVEIINTEISENRATEKAGGILNAACENVKLTDTTITGNSAPVYGGFYFQGSDYTETVLQAQGKMIVQNNAPDDITLENGKIELTGALTDGTKMSVSATDISSAFTKNYSTYHNDEEPAKYFTTKMGDASIVVDESGELKFNINVAHNETELKSAFSSGGSVSLGDDIELTSALQLVGGTKLSLNLNGYTLRRYVETASNGGSVITVSSNSVLTILDTSGENIGTITGGNAINGGAVYSEGTLNIAGGTFTANRATKNGGGIYSTGTLTITGGIFSENTADSSGAAIYSSGTAVIENANISDNIRVADGGAIANYGTMTVIDCTINNNTATNSGGGIYNSSNNADNPCTLEISGNTTISYNNAKQGGGIFADTNSTVTLTNGELKRNTTSGEGGGVYVQTGATFIMAGGVITNSVANANGGAVMNYGTVTMTGGTISNNTSELNGGGIYQAGTLNMQGAVVVTNNSLEDVYLLKDKKITVTGKFVQTTDDTKGTVIGIGLPNDESTVITTNYRRYNDTNPSAYFVGGISTNATTELQGNEVKITLTPVPMDIAQETEAVIDYEYDEFGEKIGINNISISPYYFYDISNITGSRQLTVGTLEQVSSHLFTSWAPIATRIFSTYTDATFHNTGSWSKWFGSGVSEEDQKTDIGAYFAGTNPSGDRYEHGEKSNDYIVTSGLSYANDLNDIVNRMSKDVADGMGDRYNTPASTIYDKCDLKTIKEMNKDNKTHAFYRTVTQIDENGATYGYYFNSYTVAFYDFQLSPVSVPGIQMSNIKEKKTSSSNQVSDNSGYFENKSTLYSDVSINLQTSYEESISNSFTDTNSFKVGDTFEVGYETAFGTALDAAKHKLEIKNSTTIEKVWESSQTEEHGITSTFDESTSASLTLPPHTAIQINQSEEDISVAMTYDCPTILRYKVAIFSMSGFRYDDRALTEYWTDTKDFYTIFGSGNAQGGTYATDNLYARAFANKNKLERAYGNVVGHKNGRTVVTEINWNDFNDLRTPLLKASTNIPLFASGATVSITQKSKSTVLGNLHPLYALDHIVQTEGENHYEFTTGDKFNLAALKVTGYNSYDILYYNFADNAGRWVACDEDGNELEENAVIAINQKTGKGLLTAKGPGEVYIKWVINDDITYTSKYGEDVTSTTNAPKSPMVHITVNGTPDSFSGYVVRTEGDTPQVIAGETLNLFNALSPAVYDDEDILFTRAVTFEAQDQSETSPITIDENGCFVSTQAGTYKVRARYTKNGVSIKSAWINVIVTPAPIIDNILVTPGEMEYTGGTATVTFTGSCLHDMKVILSDENGAELSAYSTGSDITQSVSFEIPENSGSTQDKVYTVSYELYDDVLMTDATVVVSPQESEGITKVALNNGQVYYANFTIPEEDTYTFKSKNAAVATVNSKGRIVARGAGSTDIVLKTSSGVVQTWQVTVNDTSELTLDKESLTLDYKGSYTLMAEYSGDEQCTWKSSNPDVVSVNSQGRIVARGIGTATITVRTTSGVATCEVTVNAIAGTFLDRSVLNMILKEQYTLKTDLPDDVTVVYKSDNASVATVNSAGRIVARGEGVATIKAIASNGNISYCSVNVTSDYEETITFGEE